MASRKRTCPSSGIVKMVIQSKSGNVESSSTRVPPTSSNRKKLEMERLKARVDEERLGIDKANSSSTSTEDDDRENEEEHENVVEEEDEEQHDQEIKERHEHEVEEQHEHEVEEQHEHEVEEVRSKNKGKKVMTESPTDSRQTDLQPSLLFAFEDHIASSIWNAKEPRDEARITKLHSHVGTQKRWNLSNECEFVKNAVAESGFGNMIKYAHERIDKVLINALIERFYPETNTFHLPFGEMGISIDEVLRITGLPVDGKAVTGPLGGSRGISDDNVYDLLGECFSIDSKTADDMLGGEKKVRLEWLRTKFSGSQEKDRAESKRQCAIAYLLYTIGVLVCGDKSGNKVSVHFLQCLRDLREVRTYSWGTACLSWLFYNLAQGTRKGIRQIAWCMTLLQVWIYEHFPILRRHNRSVRAVLSEPRSAFYFAIEPSNRLSFDLVTLREKIDDLQANDVIWDCLKDIRQQYPFQRCSLYNGIIVCFEVVELYLPPRFLRQFGYVQPIPANPFTMDKNKLKSSSKGYKAIYSNLGDFAWNEWRNHLLHDDLTSRQVVCPSDCHDQYMEWYLSVSHPLVANPQSRITERVRSSEQNSHVVRLKRRLRRIAEFIKTYTPSDAMSQVLERVERIEEDEPLDIYGEYVCDKDEAEGTTTKKTKSAAIGEHASTTVKKANQKEQKRGNKKKGAINKQVKKRRTK